MMKMRCWEIMRTLRVSLEKECWEIMRTLRVSLEESGPWGPVQLHKSQRGGGLTCDLDVCNESNCELLGD